MMTPAETELAREMARHPEFPRSPRSLYLDDSGRPWTHVGAGVYVDGAMQVVIAPKVALIPDLSDPATWGGLLAQLPLPLDLVALGGHASLNVLTGVGTVAVRGTTMGEAVARAWLATRGAK